MEITLWINNKKKRQVLSTDNWTSKCNCRGLFFFWFCARKTVLNGVSVVFSLFSIHHSHTYRIQILEDARTTKQYHGIIINLTKKKKIFNTCCEKLYSSYTMNFKDPSDLSPPSYVFLQQIRWSPGEIVRNVLPQCFSTGTKGNIFLFSIIYESNWRNSLFIHITGNDEDNRQPIIQLDFYQYKFIIPNAELMYWQWFVQFRYDAYRPYPMASSSTHRLPLTHIYKCPFAFILLYWLSSTLANPIRNK